ncbi:MAG: hypothetical protein WBX50_10265 [Candidatus Deferrimicrobiaceae bacterium]
MPCSWQSISPENAYLGLAPLRPGREIHGDFDSLEGVFSERYLTLKGQGVFSMVRPSETDRTLLRLASDLFAVMLKVLGLNLRRAADAW